jgi:hypothetical protein
MLARRRAAHVQRRSVSSALPWSACRSLCGKVFRARLDHTAGSQELRGILDNLGGFASLCAINLGRLGGWCDLRRKFRPYRS